MINYRKILILQYLYIKNEEYRVKDMVSMLGLTYQTVEEILMQMLEENLVEYRAYVLSITEKGFKEIESILVDSNKSIEDSVNFKINTDKALPIDIPYVPYNFKGE